MPGRRLPHHRVHLPHARPQEPAHRQDLLEVGERGGDHGRTGLGQPVVQQVDVGERRGEGLARPGDVVHPDATGDQVRLHRHGGGQLTVEHVADAPPADGKVSVQDTGVQFLEPGRQPVGETCHARLVVAVPQTFGLTVAEGDVSQV